MTIFKVRTRFMKEKISKYVSNYISKEIGCNADIWIRDIELSMQRGRINWHIDMWGGVNRKELVNAIKSSKD